MDELLLLVIASPVKKWLDVLPYVLIFTTTYFNNKWLETTKTEKKHGSSISFYTEMYSRRHNY